MSDEQPPIRDTPDPSTAVGAPAEPPYEPIEEDEWLDEPAELPRRPRRRLLTPIPLALLAVLIVACGFIAGVLVEKGQTSGSSGGGASFASRLAALRGGASSAGGSATSGASTTGAGAAAGAGLPGRVGGSSGGTGAGGATAGQVAYISGSTLYVSTAEGNTIKVTTSAGSSVTKTVKASVKDVHPGETVLVTGTSGSNGAIIAESIRVGAGAGGGLGALLGGAGASGAGTGARGSGGGGSSGSGGSGEPALFGKGG
jgi:hypothetical protein